MLFFKLNRAENLPLSTRLFLKLEGQFDVLKELWPGNQEIVTNLLSDHGRVTFFSRSQIPFLYDAQVKSKVLPAVKLRESNSICRDFRREKNFHRSKSTGQYIISSYNCPNSQFDCGFLSHIQMLSLIYVQIIF